MEVSNCCPSNFTLYSSCLSISCCVILMEYCFELLLEHDCQVILLLFVLILCFVLYSFFITIVRPHLLLFFFLPLLVELLNIFLPFFFRFIVSFLCLCGPLFPVFFSSLECLCEVFPRHSLNLMMFASSFSVSLSLSSFRASHFSSPLSPFLFLYPLNYQHSLSPSSFPSPSLPPDQ